MPSDTERHISHPDRLRLCTLAATVAALLFCLLPTSAAQAKRLHFKLGISDRHSSMHNDAITGFYAAIFDRANADVEFCEFPLKRSKQMLKTGTIDGEVLRISIPEPIKGIALKVDEELLPVRHGIYTLKDKLQHIDSLEKINQYARKQLVIGYERGSVAAKELIQSLAPQHSGYVINNTLQGLKMLQKGRIDILISLESEADCIINTAEPLSSQVVHRGTVRSTPGFIILHQRHAAFAKKLANVIHQMKKDRSYQQLYYKLANRQHCSINEQ